MVCLGNICRSPLAEGILKSKLSNKSFLVDSAGTANYHVGNSPDKRSVAVAKKYGLDISNLRGRQFCVSDFDIFDFIYVMDESNYKNVIKLARNKTEVSKVKMILNEVYPNQNYDVHPIQRSQVFTVRKKLPPKEHNQSTQQLIMVQSDVGGQHGAL